jgi:hypothetical protein
MKQFSRLTSFVILNGFLVSLAAVSVHAGSSKTSGTAAGNAHVHTRDRTVVNTNAQWSADPEQGWIRNDQRRKAHERHQPTSQFKKDSGKHKDHNAKDTVDTVKNSLSKAVVNKAERK